MRDFESWFNQSVNETAKQLETKPKERVLTEEAQYDRDIFESDYADYSCSCHLSPPCGRCCHPGNPNNQDEDPECWTYS